MTFDSKIQHLLSDAAPRAFDGQLEDFAGHFRLVNEELVQVRRSPSRCLQSISSLYQTAHGLLLFDFDFCK